MRFGKLSAVPKIYKPIIQNLFYPPLYDSGAAYKRYPLELPLPAQQIEEDVLIEHAWKKQNEPLRYFWEMRRESHKRNGIITRWLQKIGL